MRWLWHAAVAGTALFLVGCGASEEASVVEQLPDTIWFTSDVESTRYTEFGPDQVALSFTGGDPLDLLITDSCGVGLLPLRATEFPQRVEVVPYFGALCNWTNEGSFIAHGFRMEVIDDSLLLSNSRVKVTAVRATPADDWSFAPARQMSADEVAAPELFVSADGHRAGQRRTRYRVLADGRNADTGDPAYPALVVEFSELPGEATVEARLHAARYIADQIRLRCDVGLQATVADDEAGRLRLESVLPSDATTDVARGCDEDPIAEPGLFDVPLQPSGHTAELELTAPDGRTFTLRLLQTSVHLGPAG